MIALAQSAISSIPGVPNARRAPAAPARAALLCQEYAYTLTMTTVWTISVFPISGFTGSHRFARAPCQAALGQRGFKADGRAGAGRAAHVECKPGRRGGRTPP